MKLELKDFWNDKDNNFIIDENAVNKFNVWFDTYVKQNHYGIDENILHNYVKNIGLNASREYIYTVVTLLNSFYSTRMDAKECLKIADILFEKHKDILNVMDLKEQPEKGIQLFQEIVQDQKNKAKHAEFSFTTKYFSILGRFYKKADLYPIYDSVVAKLLNYYFYNSPEYKEYYHHNKKTVSSCNSTEKNYEKYVGLIKGFGISPYKKLDNYLWTLGRLISNKIKDKKKGQNEPSWFVLVDQNISLGNLMSDIIEDINKNNVKI